MIPDDESPTKNSLSKSCKIERPQNSELARKRASLENLITWRPKTRFGESKLEDIWVPENPGVRPSARPSGFVWSFTVY